MPKKSKKKFKPVQFDKNPEPKIKFSLKLLFWVWVLVMVAFFICYMVLANFTDAFIVVKNKNSNSNSGSVSEQLDESQQTANAVNPVPQSADKQGISYLSNCTFAGDILLAGVSDSGVSDNHIKCGPSYILTNIESSGLTVTDSNLYLMLGYTEIGEQSSDDLLIKYENVLKNFKTSFPNTSIYVMALPPVTDTNTKVLNSSIDEFNSNLLTLANNENVYYIDTNTILKSNTGYLSSEYSDGDSLNESAYDKIIDYLLSHTVISD